MSESPESRHRACWYSRRTAEIPPDIGFHTIEDGLLLYCAHPMWFPVVGKPLQSILACEYFDANPLTTHKVTRDKAATPFTSSNQRVLAVAASFDIRIRGDLARVPLLGYWSPVPRG